MYIENLSFQHYNQAPYFFKNLSFTLEEGRIHALHGKNGVGKSVLLNILSRNQERGSVLTGEIYPETAILMSQRFDQMLAGEFNFSENLSFASLKPFPNAFVPLKSATVPPSFSALLQRFHIDVTLPVHRLSGGQRQILALLMQLQKNPPLLLLDEPTATLDAQNATMVFEFLKTLKGVTILVVCHDRELIHRYVTGRHLYLEIDGDGVRRLKPV